MTAARKRRKPNFARHVAPKVITTVVAVATAIVWAFTAVKMVAEDPVRNISTESNLASLLKVEIPDDVPEQMLFYEGFTVSFNSAHHQPNYSAWEITREKTYGESPRKAKFRPDNDVYGCAQLNDYRKSGYDRGHMAPAADMKWNDNAMHDSHLLTNICPQNHEINGGRWSTIEKMCRTWARRDSVALVICGPVLSDYMPSAIGANQVSVPERFFKVVLLPFTEPPLAVGFIVPNSPTDQSIESMSMSVDQVEEITGFDFFSALPDDIENDIERKNSYRAIANLPYH